MPLAIPGRTRDAVVVAAADAGWQARVGRFLGQLGVEQARVAWQLDLLEQRWAGRLAWVSQLAGRTLPSGRPMPPGRAYAEMLVTESTLPLHDAGGWRFSLDLHNPDNEAGVAWFDEGEVEIAIVADQGVFTGPASPPGEGLGAAYARRAAAGARLGELVASLAEHVEARFAYADVGSSGGLVAAVSRPSSVVHPASATLRASDFLWSITLWGPALLGSELPGRLDQLVLHPGQLARLDAAVRPHVRLEHRALGYGARMLQYRFLFGSELHGERAAIDTPLAEQLGLRSTNLRYRA